MNLHRWITIFAGGVFGIFNMAMAQDTPWSYDFEEMSSGFRADSRSQLSVSTNHFKSGQHSLEWKWEGQGRILFTDPAPGRRRSVTLESFRAWVYSETAMEDAVLTFRFGTKSELASDNPRYKFKFGLNFVGWRAMWIHLKDDALNNSYMGPKNGRVTAFEIRAPRDVSQGSVFLDLVEMVTGNSIHRRVADKQVPFVAGGADVDASKVAEASKVQNRELRWSLKTLPGRLPSQITAEERQAFETIVQRYETWVLGNNVKDDEPEPVRIRLNALANYIQRGHRNLANYDIRREDDRILGRPLFADVSPYTPTFQSVFQGVLLRLVLDYRLNGNEEAKKRVIDVFDYLHDQGWADGSGIGSLYHEFLRMAGYAHAVFLMQKELRATGRLDREVAALAWHCMFGELYAENWDPGTNADFLRSVAIFRLFRVLLMDDTPEKVANMHRYVAWLNNALDIAPGWLDTIKPDYTGFHHQGIYASAYAPNAFHMASLLVFLLRDTPFAVADDKRDNLKQALLTANVMTNTYDISTAINGRFPYHTDMANKLLPAYMYLAKSYASVDAELAGAFMQLWQPESAFLKDDLFTRVSVGIMYLHTLGAMQMMTDFASAGHLPVAAPSGHWTLPYGALSIHRRKDWMVSMKGWSKYVWDYESSGSSNPLGRYLSYGSMLIYASGDPVGREASGIVRDGWDWSMWPGTTVIRLRHEELRHEGSQRNFSSETFVGGVNIEGQNGIFALKMKGTEHSASFRAVKTVFCFDDVLVCLGSGINNNDVVNETVTPLFQASISEDRPTWVNGSGVLAIPFTFSGTAGEKTLLMDSRGNGYVIPDGDGLKVQREVQAPGDIGNEGGTGTFELAYFDHGRTPVDKGYEYAVLVQQPFSRVRRFADAPEYDVLQKDSQAHIVHHRGLKTTGYALFDEDARPANGPVESVSLPSLLMTREVDDGLLLSVADPDFGWSWEIQTPHRQGSLVVNQPSEPRDVKVTMHGKWRLDGIDALAVATVQSEQTVVTFTCQDGKSVEVKLIGTGASLASLDFDGDGVVGSTDFLLFTSKFGLSEGDVGFEAKYDLDGNGTVGFSDFVIFSEGFGKPVSGKPVALRNGGERLGS